MIHVRLAGREESIYGDMPASVPIRVSVMQAPLDIAGGSIYDNASLLDLEVQRALRALSQATLISPFSNVPR